MPRIVRVKLHPNRIDGIEYPGDRPVPRTRTADPRRFEAKNYWVIRNKLCLHPYQEDVPYMQAYNPILLENDRYTEILLRRLSKGSPSFHSFRDEPPARVLDLGCGPGYWLLQAAKIWRNSELVGLDLVNIAHSSLSEQRNIELVQGDFLNYPLPFPDSQFDYVRMANLTLCISFHKWSFVIREVQRILAPCGVLEVIDDQMHFPYGDDPAMLKDSASHHPKPISRPTRETESSYSIKDDHGNEHPVMFSNDTPEPPSVPKHGWAQETHNSHMLEAVFERMLVEEHGIHTRPAVFLENLLRGVFGKRFSGKVQSFHLQLSPVLQKDARTLRHKLEKRRKPVSVSPASSNPQAVPHHLGLKFGSSFIEMTANELEMHAFKNMHALVGCHAAIERFLAKHRDAKGRRLVSAEELDSRIWQYECFRRKRFNWPDEAIESHESSKFKTTSQFSPSTPDPTSRDLRLIRVYEAVKSPIRLENIYR